MHKRVFSRSFLRDGEQIWWNLHVYHVWITNMFTAFNINCICDAVCMDNTWTSPVWALMDHRPVEGFTVVIPVIRINLLIWDTVVNTWVIFMRFFYWCLCLNFAGFMSSSFPGSNMCVNANSSIISEAATKAANGFLMSSSTSWLQKKWTLVFLTKGNKSVGLTSEWI